MRYELDHAGEIVEYNGDVQLLDSRRISDVIQELFSQGVYDCKITNHEGSVYDLEIVNGIDKSVENITLYYGNIRNENRNSKEKKIQLNKKDPRESILPAIILGLYCFNTNDDLKNLICSAWFVDETFNYQSNPSIRGINVDLFQQARFNGFERKEYRNNIACVFRPEFIDYYLKNRDKIHIETDTDIANVSQPLDVEKNEILQSNFNFYEFQNAVEDSGLIFSKGLIQRFVASLQTKPFVILTGLAGSGKTKLAEAFSSWICEKEDQICMISVGADWTNREPLLGFPNALASNKYIKPESGALDLIISAQNNPGYPYFLILDEMNMSHVERYFADFLSAMESVNSSISLHPGDKEWDDVPSKIELPKNLFIIGTVNVDETTYMFSPKVLDRANVIEFRVTELQMSDYLANIPRKLNMKNLGHKGAAMAKDFVSKTLIESEENLNGELMPFFGNLQGVGAEFGYRSAYEISKFVSIYNSMTGGVIDEAHAIDAAIAQKLLPKLHGSRNKLDKILIILARQCLHDPSIEGVFKGVTEDDIKYRISYEKLERMHGRIIADGFTSFAEA